MGLVGTEWQHVKRGSRYRVLMDAVMEWTSLGDLEDGNEAVVYPVRGGFAMIPDDMYVPMAGDTMALPVTVQMSRPTTTDPLNWIVYMGLDGEKAGAIWARPAGEFIDGRFRQTADEAGDGE